jgi:hypothetical protein
MRIGLALRSTVFNPSLIARMVPSIDDSAIDSIWFPSVGKAFDALDMCGVSLGKSRRLSVGTGVIRTSDFAEERLLARVHTLREGSDGRFVLGIGTGSGTGRVALEGLVEVARKLAADYPEQHRPTIFFAALKRKALREAYFNAQGAILNFCSPKYARTIARGNTPKSDFTLACYVKLFFAQDDERAKRMLVQEMKMYAAIPQYHAMFEEMGVSGAIAALEGSSAIPQELQEISLANPSDSEILSMMEDFSGAGVNLPIVYPYVGGDDSYKKAVVERLSKLSAT